MISLFGAKRSSRKRWRRHKLFSHDAKKSIFSTSSASASYLHFRSFFSFVISLWLLIIFVILPHVTQFLFHLEALPEVLLSCQDLPKQTLFSEKECPTIKMMLQKILRKNEQSGERERERQTLKQQHKTVDTDDSERDHRQRRKKGISRMNGSNQSQETDK